MQRSELEKKPAADAELQRPFSARAQPAGNERPELRAPASWLCRPLSAAVRLVQYMAAVHIAVSVDRHKAAPDTAARGGKHKAALHTAAMHAVQHKADLHIGVRAVKQTPGLAAAAHAP